MVTDLNRVPDLVRPELPSSARIYDFLLGGGHNFAIDRLVGGEVLRVLPNARRLVCTNRTFLTRAVRFLVAHGITQFLDLGSGIPTAGNVHEIAQQANPACRVVYVDYDEVVVGHSERLLANVDRVAVVRADLTCPDEVLADPAVGRLIDFDRPVGLLSAAVLHYLPDCRRPGDLVARYLAAVPSGSYLALSHLTADQQPAAMAGVVRAMRASREPLHMRSHAEVRALFDGLDLVEPGVVDAARWHGEPGEDGTPQGIYAGVGRKP